MANYTKEKSRYGGHVGTVIIHSTPGIGINNDPNTAVFKNNLPAGYLKCDGSIRNVKEFYALAQVLGIGDACRFKKPDVELKNADPNIGFLGQFQLPDLGSKVIIGGRASGLYSNFLVEDEGGTGTVTRVGPQVAVSSNVGNTISAPYVGNVSVSAVSGINMVGNPKYVLPRSTSQTVLDIENFQGHAHNSNQKYLNYTATHRVGGEGGKDGGLRLANSGSGNILEESSQGGGTSSHEHRITKPITYSSNFKYGHGSISASMEGVTASIDVDLSTVNKLDEVVTPFILVEYLIKF